MTYPPNNTSGETRRTSSKTDTTRSFYTNSKGTKVPFSRDYPHGFVELIHNKSSVVKGDHFQSYPYERNTREVTKNSPCRISARGVDANGPWEDVRVIHMSQWVPLSVLDIPSNVIDDTRNARNQTVTEALNKLRDGKSDWGTNVLQARMTADMIAGKAAQVLYAYRSLRRGNVALALKHLGMSKRNIRRRASSQWLEYIYGWLPLVNDVYTGIDTLCGMFETKPPYMDIYDSTSIDFGWSKKSGGFEDTWSGSYKSRVGFKVSVSDEFLSGIDMYGLLNPAEVAWEILPGSFILDWFVPVGNTLSALSATTGLKFVTGFMSNSLELKKSSRLVNAAAIADSRFSIDSGGDLQVEASYFERIAYRAFPRPRFYVDSTPFNSNRIGAAIALINQRAR